MKPRLYPLIAPLLLMITLAVLAIVGVQPGYAGAVAGQAGGDTLLGPLTSVDSANALRQLEADINNIIQKNNLSRSSAGVLVKWLKNDHTLFAYNPSLPLTPASTTKLVTTFTALRELGVDYTISTIAAATENPVHGVLHGDLYLKGHGDPYLAVSDIDRLADQIQAAGITRIEGNILGDATFMDDKYQRIEYSGDNEVVEPTPPICALSLNQNRFSVIVSSAREAGIPLNVQTYPRSSGFEIINTALSSGRAAAKAPNNNNRGSAGRNLRKGRSAVPGRASGKKSGAGKGRRRHSGLLWPGQVYTGVSQKYGDKYTVNRHAGVPYKMPGDPPTQKSGSLMVEVSGSATEKQVIKISGTLAANRTMVFKYPMRNPAMIIAGILYDRLVSRGIVITGNPYFGAAPRRRVVLASVGRPLLDVLTTLMKRSDNYLAECTFKIIGGKNGGLPETAVLSRQAESRQMTACRVPFDGCALNDGSGLSRRNRLTCNTLCGILSAAYRDKKLFGALYSTMSVAGQDGTLRKRMRGTFAQGNVHGKTGTLNNVSALTGYVTTRDGDMFCFAMLMNGGSGFHPPQDEIAKRLAAFSFRDGHKPAEGAGTALTGGQAADLTGKSARKGK